MLPFILFPSESVLPSTIIVALAMHVPLRTHMMGDEDGKRDILIRWL